MDAVSTEPSVYINNHLIRLTVRSGQPERNVDVRSYHKDARSTKCSNSIKMSSSALTASLCQDPNLSGCKQMTEGDDFAKFWLA